MRKLSAKEWIAVAIAVIAVGYFVMGNMATQMFDQGDSASVQAAAGDVVTVHYVGRLTDGRVFDSSRERGKPFSFTLGVGDVIQGWDQGLVGAKPGEKKTISIPPEQAYGAVPGHPLQKETLIFDIEVLEVNKK